MKIACERWFDLADFVRRHLVALKPGAGQQFVGIEGGIELCLCLVYMQEPCIAPVEGDALAFDDVPKALPRMQRHSRQLGRVIPPAQTFAGKFGEPDQLVPVGPEPDTERCVVPEHRTERGADAMPIVPDLGVGNGNLTAVGERGFHRCPIVAIIKDDALAPPCQVVCREHAGDAGADDRCSIHGGLIATGRRPGHGYILVRRPAPISVRMMWIF